MTTPIDQNGGVDLAPKGLRTPLVVAAQSASTSYRVVLQPEMLEQALRTCVIPIVFEPHIGTLLEEAPLTMLGKEASQISAVGGSGLVQHARAGHTVEDRKGYQRASNAEGGAGQGRGRCGGRTEIGAQPLGGSAWLSRWLHVHAKSKLGVRQARRRLVKPGDLAAMHPPGGQRDADAIVHQHLHASGASVDQHRELEQFFDPEVARLRRRRRVMMNPQTLCDLE